MTEQNTSRLKNILAIAGFIILLIVGVWSAIQVIQFVPRLFSDTGVSDQPIGNNGGVVPGSSEAIVAQASTYNTASGEPVVITWAHAGSADEGVVSFSYACVDGVYFQIDDRAVPCNAPLSLSPEATALTAIPVSTHATVDVPFAITYTSTENESVRDTLTLTVTNGQVAAAPSESEEPTSGGAVGSGGGPIEPTPAPRTAGVPQRAVETETVRVPRQSDPFGIADLFVQMVAVGEVTHIGAFEAKGIVHPYARGAAKFRVTNTGTKATGPWAFSAILPTRGGYPFTSQLQPSLMPGSSTEIVVTFDQLVPGAHYFSVTLDPLNHVPERNEFNNRATQALTVLNY